MRSGTSINKKIAESLTPELIENNKISKWNGDVPTVSGAGATIVDIGSVTSAPVEANDIGGNNGD